MQLTSDQLYRDTTCPREDPIQQQGETKSVLFSISRCDALCRWKFDSSSCPRFYCTRFLWDSISWGLYCPKSDFTAGGENTSERKTEQLLQIAQSTNARTKPLQPKYAHLNIKNQVKHPQNADCCSYNLKPNPSIFFSLWSAQCKLDLCMKIEDINHICLSVNMMEIMLTPTCWFSDTFCSWFMDVYCFFSFSIVLLNEMFITHNCLLGLWVQSGVDPVGGFTPSFDKYKYPKFFLFCTVIIFKTVSVPSDCRRFSWATNALSRALWDQHTLINHHSRQRQEKHAMQPHCPPSWNYSGLFPGEYKEPRWDQLLQKNWVNLSRTWGWEKILTYEEQDVTEWPLTSNRPLMFQM